MGNKRRKLKTRIKELQARIQQLEGELEKQNQSAMAGLPPVSPLAPRQGFPQLPAIAGARFSTAIAGIKNRDRCDVLLARLCAGSTIAGVFTKSATRSAAVDDCQEKVAKLREQPDTDNGFAILVNSGNANAFTGCTGMETVASLSNAVGAQLRLPAENVFTASTGVIGERLDESLILAVLKQLKTNLDAANLDAAARAIMTTDTFAKGAGGLFDIGGDEVAIAGIAKGSGMIAPDMATMLSFVFTDISVEQSLLQSIVTTVNSSTFNAVSVDGDTSTSDTVLVVATGQHPGRPINDAGSSRTKAFAAALEEVFTDLAQQIVRDGEGASKFVEVQVVNAVTREDAERVARSIANSPLVKTAIAGEDPNWGRIVMAVGKSGARVDRDRLTILFGNILVAERGQVAAGYREEDGAGYMRNAEISICTDLGMGTKSARLWTCDFTRNYIAINADYRS